MARGDVSRELGGIYFLRMTILVTLLMIYERYASELDRAVQNMNNRWRYCLYYAAVIAIAIFGNFDGAQFVYFQF